MLTRVAIPLLLLPLLALGLPLMFVWAWVQEAISERAPPDHPSMES
jgi:HAMP domain-containing protein